MSRDLQQFPRYETFPWSPSAVFSPFEPPLQLSLRKRVWKGAHRAGGPPQTHRCDRVASCGFSTPDERALIKGTSWYRPESPTSTYTMRASAACWPPKRAATRSNWNRPTRPQFTEPTMIRTNVRMFTTFMIVLL